MDSLRQKRQLAEASAAQATTATQQGDPAAAAQALAAAKDLWRDRPDGEWPNLASAAPGPGPGPATPPSKAPARAGGVPCTPNLAGKGKSARAVCYDRIGDQFQGPPLVVVPAGGGGGSFAIGRYEVSFEDFNQYCTASAACQSLGGDRRAPVTGIPLESAMSYLSWLSAQTGHKYRLPTAGEWEHAATSGGASTDKNYNCRLVVNGTVMKGQGSLNVKSGRPNPWGLYNAVGNVQEWIDGGKVRGGAFDDAIEECAPTLEKDHAGTPDDFTGFRAVRDLG